MSLGPIVQLKEKGRTYQPLLLCEFTFTDGTVYRASTHPLSVRYGGNAGYEFGGFEWEPRVQNQQIGATQAMSDIGVDVPPNVEIILADPDTTLRTNREIPKGFKGAILRIYAIMMDAGNTSTVTGAFSSDTPWIVKFIGTCDAPEWDSGSLVVSARSLLNISQTMMPPLRIQQLCSWTFPTNHADRVVGKSDPSSVFHRCGYSPDISGGVGNYQSGTAAFTSCEYTRGACVSRLGNGALPSGQLDNDELGRDTGRFSGFTYVPETSSGLQRSYTTGNWSEIINASTQTKYGDFGPICYGTTWVVPKIMGVFGDGNYTSWEVLVNIGEVDRIHTVLVNGYKIPLLAGDVARPIPGDEVTTTFKNGFWTPINDGFRNGLSNPLPGWGNLGDPYGSLTAIYVHVLNEVATANALPEIQILLDGCHVRKYTSVTSFTTGFSRNPAWVLMDVLRFCGWRYQDFDLESWIRAARICDETIFFNSMDGTYQNFYNETGNPSYTRYSVGFSLSTRTSISEVIRGLRNAMRGILYFDYYTGKLTLVSKQTIASQQPGTIYGSNSVIPIDSVTVQGVTKQGYSAYDFNGTNIVKIGDKSTLTMTPLKNTEAPNKISEVFQNRENTYNQDAAVVVDTEDTSRMGGYPISGTFPILGGQTFDHVRRVTFAYMAECYRGNLRLDYHGSATGDTGGTMLFTWKTSVKGIHLVCGHICTITDEQSQGLIDKLPVRVTKIKPDMNFEMVEITAAAHNDTWYLDTFGQVNSPMYGNFTNPSSRAPFAWEAGVLQANPDDQMYGQDVTFFDVVPVYLQTVGNQPFAYVQISGIPPVNVFDPVLQKPRIASPGSAISNPSGWPIDNYFMAVAQYRVGTSGAIGVSPLSVIAGVPADVAGDLKVVVKSWPATGADGHLACVGRDLEDLFWSGVTGALSTSPVSGSITAGNFLEQLHCPPPDELFARFRWRVQEEIWPGIFKSRIASISYADDGSGDTTLAVSLVGSVSTSAWVGRSISFVGMNADNVSASVSSSIIPRIPVANLEILSNNSDGSLVARGNPLNNGSPFVAGDMVVVRFSPTFGSDSIGFYFEDLLAVSPFNTGGFGTNILSGFQIFIVSGTGKGTYATIMFNTPTRCYVQKWPMTPDVTSQVVILNSALRADQASTPVLNSILNLPDVSSVPSYLVDVTTLQHKMLFVQAFTESAKGVMSSSVLSPFRELYVFDGSVDGVLINGVGGPGNLG